MPANKMASTLKQQAIFALALMALVTGCADTAAIKALLTPLTEEAVGSTSPPSAFNNPWPQTDWWQPHDDGQLGDLIRQALADNPDLAAANARVRQASAMALQAGFDRQAQINGTATAQAVHAPDALAPDSSEISTLQALVLAGSYSLDLWGGKQAAWQAALGAQRAAEVDAQAAQLALTVAIVRSYAQLGYNVALKALAENDAKRATQALSLARQRVVAGIDNKLGLQGAQADVESARQRVLALENAINQNRFALAMLAGQGSGRAETITPPTMPLAMAATVPESLPAELLGRRPDIVAAKWRVLAADRQIDVAKASYYPNIDLAANLGFVAFDSGTLLSLPNRFYSLAPTVSLPIFKRERLDASLSARTADYDLAVAHYNKTLIGAFNEVAELAKAGHSLAQQDQHQARIIATQTQAIALAQLRYQRGIGNVIEVLAAEEELIAARMAQTRLQSQMVDTALQLVNALGGGYRDQTLALTQPPPSLPQGQTTGTLE